MNLVFLRVRLLECQFSAISRYLPLEVRVFPIEGLSNYLCEIYTYLVGLWVIFFL